jgi:hypothetical protein
MRCSLPKPCRSCAQYIRRCRNYLAFRVCQELDLENFAYNVALNLIEVCDACAGLFLDTIPERDILDFFAFLRDYLEPVDFMPNPAPFIAGVGTTEEQERVKQLFRPKYLTLYEMTRERVCRIVPGQITARPSP